MPVDILWSEWSSDKSSCAKLANIGIRGIEKEIAMSMRSSLVRTILMFCAGCLSIIGAASAAPDEALLDAAMREQAALVDTLKTLVLIESGSNDADGLARMATVLEDRLQALGFETERRTSKVGVGADTVIGTLIGTGRQKVMLMAHIDTVYAKGILQSEPYKIDGNRLYGPGIADAKGGIAVILHTLEILADSGWKDFATLTVLFNPDEELGSPGSRDVIGEFAEQSDTVLSFEPTGTQDRGAWLLLGTATYVSVRMEVQGRASHAGNAPDAGRNAVIELAHQLLRTRNVAKDIPGVQLNWTNVISDKAFNQIPDMAVAVADVRITIPGAEKALLEELQTMVDSEKLIPDTKTTVTGTILNPGLKATSESHSAAQLALRIYGEVHDGKFWIVDMAKGATDAAFAGRSGKAVVLECLGLPGANYHARDEYIEIDAIPRHLYLASRLLVELGKQ